MQLQALQAHVNKSSVQVVTFTKIMYLITKQKLSYLPCWLGWLTGWLVGWLTLTPASKSETLEIRVENMLKTQKKEVCRQARCTNNLSLGVQFTSTRWIVDLVCTTYKSIRVPPTNLRGSNTINMVQTSL